nr:MAG TPA_asm: hypothetical protein [Caudoviricetes sp.]
MLSMLHFNRSNRSKFLHYVIYLSYDCYISICICLLS